MNGKPYELLTIYNRNIYIFKRDSKSKEANFCKVDFF